MIALGQYGIMKGTPMTECGYARVSSRDQNLDRQLDALRKFPIADNRIYADKASGATFDRPRYKTLQKRLSAGDVLVIMSVNRLGRNYEEILEQWRFLTQRKGVDIVVMDMPLLDTRASSEALKGITGVFLTDVVLQLLSYVAQIERENIRQRQAEGIAAAKARGKRFGRPRLPKPSGYEEVRLRYLEGKVSKSGGARLLGVSRGTFDKWLKESEEVSGVHDMELNAF